MKTFLKIIQTIGLVVLSLGVLSCEDDSKSSESEIDQISQDLGLGTWKITKFIDSGKDETSSFNGFLFTFNPNGSLVATNGVNTFTGTWSIVKDSSDDSPDDLDFTIFFPVSTKFEDLNDDWDITSHSASKIELIDVSGGNGGTDYLTFQKN
ncbi:hypothetical protein [Algoriphagus sp. AK58]|uniref:hypothetical protein n=1 Tax=Algoriphagus sp. AK58 TaxID=1406877 RepID=UPI001C9C71E3|nr:hypothetical protein [Algoriphagus sp. AK58]